MEHSKNTALPIRRHNTSMGRILAAGIFVGFLSASVPGVRAFSPRLTRGRPTAAGALRLARKYLVIGGNLEGLIREDDSSLSKKERRRREREEGASKGKTRKKKKSTINYDKLEEKVTRERTLLPREMNSNNPGKKRVEKKLSARATKLKKQRTAGGRVDSTTEAASPQSPQQQAVQISVAKRAAKTVTMVQGLTIPMEDRKALLKSMKGQLGGGGTLVDGVLEVQGSHGDKILAILKSKGYTGAKVVGGKKTKS